MKKMNYFTIIIIVTILTQIFVSGCNEIDENLVYSENNLIISDKTSNYPVNLQEFYNENMTIKVYDNDEVVQGYNLLNIEFGSSYFGSKIQSVAVLDMNGNIISGLPNINKEDAEMINSTTLMYSANSSHIDFWNFVTNTTDFFPLPEGRTLHHDWEYNPLTHSFLVLGRETTIGGVDLGGELVDIVANSFYEMDEF